MDSLTGISQIRLRIGLLLFFVALTIPSGILIQQVLSQIKWQSFHQHRSIAEQLTAGIDLNLRHLIDQEESRAFTDYQFLVAAGETEQNTLQRSQLSSLPVATSIPGAIGYFQVDSLGRLTTPLLPHAASEASVLDIASEEFAQRLALQNRIRAILSQNSLVGNGKAAVTPAPASAISEHLAAQATDKNELENGESLERRRTSLEEARSFAKSESASGQAAFDQLNSPARQNENRQKIGAIQKQGRIADFKLDYSLQSGLADQLSAREKKKAAPEKRVARKERIVVAEPEAPAMRTDLDSNRLVRDEARIHTFESEIDPFEFSLLDSGHFVLFRKVWRDQQRYIQGMLIDQQAFLEGLVNSAFEESSLAAMSDLIVAYQGNVYLAINKGTPLDYASGPAEFGGSVLYQSHLSPPLNDFEVIFSVTRLPPGPGSRLIIWVAVVLSLVLISGFSLMYRSGIAQIKLARQQRNFVSAISHELKTPLTSIRMYSEMLGTGWTPEDKKKTYYDYILSESERLTRLINNVLQLAKLGRGEVRMDIKALPVGVLLNEVRQKILSPIEAAGFQFSLAMAPGTEDLEVETDRDAFTQIIINLVDNALKFSRQADRKVIELGCRALPGKSMRFSVRDYGPGIPPNQIKKIFRLFYRAENELTRETVGTGIGLALVQQLAGLMKGQVDVINQSPGAEFRITLPVAS
ncbi:MAG: sensor histidine kinase [Methylococcales bacterium]